MICELIIFILCISPIFALLRMEFKEPNGKFGKIYAGILTILGSPWIYLSKVLIKIKN